MPTIPGTNVEVPPFPEEKFGFCAGCHRFEQRLYRTGPPDVFHYRCGACRIAGDPRPTKEDSRA